MSDKLTEILNRMRLLYEQMEMSSRAKRESILNNDPQNVERITKAQWELLNQTSALEIEREQAAAELCGDKRATLSQLLEYADDQEEMQRAADKLLAQLGVQKQLNKENEALIQMQINYASAMLSAVFSPPEAGIYGEENRPLSAVSSIDDRA